ncbi:MAG: multidrug ABC transporter substrate-binding protein [Proteobacteria bacterium]|nr:MAG: multidrug ABC transporter substrate-binding protein [Pseudomonadota bacterium]
MLGNMLREAWAAMAANKLRTFLTMLGMVIGVGAVILMLAIGQGAQMLVKQAISTMGSNLLIVLSGFSTAAGVRSGAGAAATLTVHDARAIAELSSVAAVAPMQPGSAQIVYGPSNWNTQVYGVTPAYLDVRDWRIDDGAPFTDAELRNASRVALIGLTVVRQLFGDEDPVGKTIRITNRPFVVLGVLARKGQSMDGRDQDDTVLVPLTTAKRALFGSQFPDSVRMILVQATSEDAMTRAEIAMTALLRERHRIPEGGDLDFTIRNLSAVAEVQAQTTRVMSLLLGAVASVSLVVGGIGIMNIMLVSVTERTREIGIRMAVGARRRDILAQFLLEAIIVSVIGCFIGVVLGVGGALLVTQATGTYVVITAASVLLAFLVAGAIGVFFGFYPARKASHLRPIEALRYQ